ncbi:MAG: glutamate mutase L [Chloroflexota bacterium]
MVGVSPLDAGPVLAIDIGVTTTRALLFDVVEGRYRFIAKGISSTTSAIPIHDVGEGVRMAIEEVQEVSGRLFLGSEGNIIIPSQPDGSGADAIVATLSVGPPLRVVAVGLLDDVSLESVCRLAETTYHQLVEKISLNDRRDTATRIDAIVRVRPDVVIMAGGTQDGATRSMSELIEAVGLAIYLLPGGKRPEVLFAGNQALEEEIKESLEYLTSLRIAPNIRPALEQEDLGPARKALGKIYSSVRFGHVPGMKDLEAWMGERITPTTSGFGRVVRFLSTVYDPAKGVLGVGVETNAISIAAGFEGELVQLVYPQYCMANNPEEFLSNTSLENIYRWLLFPVPKESLKDYIYNKSLYPSSVPVTREDLAIEQALVREELRLATNALLLRLPGTIVHSTDGLMPWFEPIIVRGAPFSQAPTYGQAMLMLLDGLQPTGVTTFVLDQNDLSPVLGAAAEVSSVLSIQVLESNAFLNLGTVISPVFKAREGVPVLGLRLVDEETGRTSSVEIEAGELKAIPIPSGQVVRVELRPLHSANLGFGKPASGGELRVIGGLLGLVIDARGRPLELESDPQQCRDMMRRSLWNLGG